jgi:gluconate 2-dehydrogenase gamma chain
VSNNENCSNVFHTLTNVEVRFIDAAVERLIPEDDLGPGAKEAGVSSYIDQQLSSVWGTHGRNYRSGPWLEGTAQQGFQSRLTPQEIYHVGIYEINQFCIKNYDKQFEFLDANQIDEILSKLEKDEVKLPSLSSKLFFDLLWKNTEEGFFSDPIYGGNRNKIGWKLLGFPGVSSGAYINHIDNPDLYHAEPVSILDIQQKSADVDAQGYAKHILIKQNKG